MILLRNNYRMAQKSSSYIAPSKLELLANKGKTDLTQFPTIVIV